MEEISVLAKAMLILVIFKFPCFFYSFNATKKAL